MDKSSENPGLKESALYHWRRRLLSRVLIALLQLVGALQRMWAPQRKSPPSAPRSELTRAEDLDPLQPGALDNPYPWYRLLRDQRPVYQPPGVDFWYVTRHEDILDIVRDTETYSSNIGGVTIDRRGGARLGAAKLKSPGRGSRRNWGIDPVDALAIQDAPAHGYQRKLTQVLIARDFVAPLEADVRSLCVELLEPFLLQGGGDFMHEVGWPLPMRMALRVVGFPEADYAQVKSGCADAVSQLSGLNRPGEFARSAAGVLTLFQYCWERWLEAKRQPRKDLTGALVAAANDPDDPLTDEEAVSMIFQLLIAGSDSTASTMGHAVKLLAENPQVAQRLRAEPARIADYVEEVLRLEPAFQGHFRITRKEVTLHGQRLPAGSRLFLAWASANRDERVWTDADAIDIDREQMRKHLTFGYGVHGCLGRELARMEIRMVVEALLRRTVGIGVAGPTPFVASVFVRTLAQLPLVVQRTTATMPAELPAAGSGGGKCPYGFG